MNAALAGWGVLGVGLIILVVLSYALGKRKGGAAIERLDDELERAEDAIEKHRKAAEIDARPRPADARDVVNRMP